MAIFAKDLVAFGHTERCVVSVSH